MVKYHGHLEFVPEEGLPWWKQRPWSMVLGLRERPRLPGEQRMLAGGHEGRKERGTEPQGTHRQQSQRECELERESQGGRGRQCHRLLRNWDDKA